MSHFGFLLKEGGGSIKVTLLPWICGVKFLSSLNVFAALFQNFVIREVPKLVKPGHRLAPVGDSALRVALRSFGESRFGLLVLKRVEKRDALFDRGLHVCGATGWKIHFAKLIGRRD